jgi:hypothetical protein
MAREGISTAKVALIPEFQQTVKRLRATGTRDGNTLAAEGTSIVIRLESERDHVRQEAWKDALGWYSAARAFLTA